MNPTVQLAEVLLQILPVGPPHHAIHPRGGPRVQSPVGHPQAVDVDMVQKRREPCFPVVLCDSAHAIQRT